MRFRPIALTLALAASSPLAFAASSANASLSNLKLWVFDLTPLDGVSPSFSILSALGELTYTNAGADGVGNDYQSGGLNLLSLANNGSAMAQASLVGGVDLDDFVMNSQTMSSAGRSWSYAELNLSIEFSGSTLLLITGDAAVSASSATNHAASYANAYSQVGFFNYADGSSVGGYGYVQVSTGLGYANANPSASSTISGSVSNFGAGTMLVSLDAYASSNVSAVPEPGSYAMLLAGLLAVGMVARRRA